MDRIGEPGGDRFPYLADDQVILYAVSMIRAILQYVQYFGREPSSIRLMSDNE